MVEMKQVSRKLEELHKKNMKREKLSVSFNKTYLEEFMLPKYTILEINIYIFIYQETILGEQLGQWKNSRGMLFVIGIS